MAEHSNTPWGICEHHSSDQALDIWCEKGPGIWDFRIDAGCPFSEMAYPEDAEATFRANVAHIVKAVNAHDDLVEMAKLFEKSIEYEIRRSETGGDEEGARLKFATLNMVRAALTKSEA